MTIEEKAKAYDEALNWMRAIYPSLSGADKEDAEHFFPELRESEDERIRKYLIEALKAAKSVGELKFVIPQPTREECIAYLERQKEQKPKFNSGDVLKCKSTGSLWVRCKGGDNRRSDGHTACIGGGYVLASKNEAEQFFKELDENGYTWDVLNGEPIKKEQKPFNVCEQCKCPDYNEQKSTECIDFDNEFENQISHLIASILNGEHEYNEDFIKYATQSLLGYAKNELKPDEWDKREKLFTKALRTANARIGQLFEENRKLKEQKPAEWSEEDEDMLNSCISSIEESKENRYAYKETDGDTSYDHEIAWLKSLRSPKSSDNWKPSADQMNVLLNTEGMIRASGYPENAKVLASLYEHLKQL